MFLTLFPLSRRTCEIIENIIGDVMEAQALRVNGRHASMDATRQWAPRVNGRHACASNAFERQPQASACVCDAFE